MNLNFNLENIYVAKEPIDFRKGINRLAAFAADQFGINPCDKSLYIFTNRQKNRIKCLYYDGTGYWIFYKTLHSGHFDWNMNGEGLVSLSQEQLEWLLGGLNIDTGQVFKEFYPLYV